MSSETRDKRRDELARYVSGGAWPSGEYKSLSASTRRAIDRIIELEDQLEVESGS